jgi:hypothetical protein
LPPLAPEWQQEAAKYSINAILVSFGQSSLFMLRQFCHSDEWAPVYLDEVLAVFVRLSTEDGPLIRRLR